jgi:hypothetical protein
MNYFIKSGNGKPLQGFRLFVDSVTSGFTGGYAQVVLTGQKIDLNDFGNTA